MHEYITGTQAELAQINIFYNTLMVLPAGETSQYSLITLGLDGEYYLKIKETKINGEEKTKKYLKDVLKESGLKYKTTNLTYIEMFNPIAV